MDFSHLRCADVPSIFSSYLGPDWIQSSSPLLPSQDQLSALPPDTFWSLQRHEERTRVAISKLLACPSDAGRHTSRSGKRIIWNLERSKDWKMEQPEPLHTMYLCGNRDNKSVERCSNNPSICCSVKLLLRSLSCHANYIPFLQNCWRLSVAHFIIEPMNICHPFCLTHITMFCCAHGIRFGQWSWVSIVWGGCNGHHLDWIST